MKRRKRGRSGLEVSAIGYGCMGLNYLSGRVGEENRTIGFQTTSDQETRS